MSIFGSLTTAITGLTAQSRAMGNISENIANSQTVGFKRVDSNFSNLVVQSDSRLNSPGGVVAAPNYTTGLQGTVRQVQTATNIAVTGQGMFSVVRAPDDSLRNVSLPGTTTPITPTTTSQEVLYTRDGTFELNRDRYLVNSSGYALRGWTSDPTTGQPNRTDLTPIQLTNVLDNPVSTNSINMVANLPTNPPRDVALPPSTVQIFDNLGNPQTLSVNFLRNASNQYLMRISAPGSGSQPTGGTIATPIAASAFTTNSLAAAVAPVAQVSTATLGPATIVAGRTFTVNIGGSAYSYTLNGTEASLQAVANQLAGQINADSNSLGQVTSTAAGVLTIQAKTPGTPFSISVSGTGGATPTSATGTANVVGVNQQDSILLTGTTGRVGDVFNFTFDVPALSFNYTTTGFETDMGSIAQQVAALINGNSSSPATAVANGAQIVLTAKTPTTPVYVPTLNYDGTQGGVFQGILLNFGSSPPLTGALTAMANQGAAVTLPPNFTSGAPAYVDITLNYPGAGAQAVRLNLGTFQRADGLTQFAGDTVTVRTLNQNGFARGVFRDISISENGDVVANYDNGRNRIVARVPLTLFNNPDALQRSTGNVFRETVDSGQPRSIDAGSGGAGSIVPSAVESSNVDIADEFTKLIVTQRAYSANTRVVTTTDEMLQETLGMKR